jgi:hypothetical protein
LNFIRLFFSLNLALAVGLSVSHAQTLVVDQLCELPSSIHETSGLETGPNGWFWTQNDSDNPEEIYCVDSTGTIQRTVSVMGDVNTDWEDLAKDDEGNLYIGNFGNNLLDRTDLRIVKIPSIDTCTSVAIVSDTIRFSYPDQHDFPPNGDYGNFDMEAFFWYQDSLHLFSKDRSSPSTGHTKHYRLPSVGGVYQAELIDSLYTASNSYIFAITAADISEDGQQVVLLNADRIWLLSGYTGTDFFGGTVSELELGSFTQKEGICFKDGFIYLTDEREQFFNSGGNLYRAHPSVFVGVGESLSEPDVELIYGQDLSLESIVFEGSTMDWKLLGTDGKLVRSGSSTDSILTSQFGDVHGMFVIQLTTEKSANAVLIRL